MCCLWQHVDDINSKYIVQIIPTFPFQQVPLVVNERPDVQLSVSGQVNLLLYNKLEDISCETNKDDEDILLYHDTMVERLNGYGEVVMLGGIVIGHANIPADMPSQYTVDIPVGIPPLMCPKKDLTIRLYEYYGNGAFYNPFGFTTGGAEEIPIAKTVYVVFKTTGLVTLVFEPTGSDVPEGAMVSTEQVVIRWKI